MGQWVMNNFALSGIQRYCQVEDYYAISITVAKYKLRFEDRGNDGRTLYDVVLIGSSLEISARIARVAR